MPEFNMIPPAKLMRLIGTPDVPMILDVRIDEDIATHPRLIPTARRHDFNDLDDLPALATGRRCVVVCHKGRKLSQGVAAYLRAAGVAAECLEGGAVAWAEAGLPMLPLATLPEGGLWVTRHRPKIDRIACPWLIRRFVDPAACFLFVPPRDVTAVAEKFGATPFDVPDVTFTHRADACSFDAMIADFGLSHAPLARLADVVRAADLGRLADAQQAAGLLAVSVGLGRMSRDDTELLQSAMPVYDALYRWARDGFDETHASDFGTSA